MFTSFSPARDRCFLEKSALGNKTLVARLSSVFEKYLFAVLMMCLPLFSVTLAKGSSGPFDFSGSFNSASTAVFGGEVEAVDTSGEPSGTESDSDTESDEGPESELWVPLRNVQALKRGEVDAFFGDRTDAFANQWRNDGLKRPPRA